MASYGRNFEFRVPPVHGERGGRYYIPDDGDAIPIGAPVEVSPATNSPLWTGALPVVLATGATPPVAGQHGILVYEHLNFDGFDPVMTTYSDLDTAPPGKQVQVVGGGRVKVVFKNTVDRVFLTRRNYSGRTMVAPDDLTGIAVGNGLRPGVGTDADGYWAETGVGEDAWLIVESVDTARGEVEARINF